MAKASNVTSSSTVERERQDAPPRLEPVRLFLQTWSIPNKTRVPADELSIDALSLLRERHFPDLAARPATSKELATLRALRDDLRRSLESGEVAGLEILRSWLQRLPVTVELRIDDPDGPVRYRCQSAREHIAGALLALVLEAVGAGTWRRLKVCPDCRSVFYDRTKNQNRVWCGMSAHGPAGRACGSIAKVRNWRERQKLVGAPRQ